MFTITPLDYSSCSDVLLNRKQFDSALHNAVASLFNSPISNEFLMSELTSIIWNLSERVSHSSTSYLGYLTTDSEFDTG